MHNRSGAAVALAAYVEVITVLHIKEGEREGRGLAGRETETP